jgi:hypothetical protein
MEDCRSFSTPFQSSVKLTKECYFPNVDATMYRQLVGSIIYLTHSRPDIVFVVSFLSRFMQDPKESHLKVAKRIVRYIKGTYHLGIKYYSKHFKSLVGYTDSDWPVDGDDRKETSSYVRNLRLFPCQLLKLITKAQ